MQRRRGAGQDPTGLDRLRDRGRFDMTNDSARNYWLEAVEGSFDEVGIVATTTQLANVADHMAVSHDQYDMAFGYDVASHNLQSDKDGHIVKLRQELQDERTKRTCIECDGRGTITVQGPCHSATSDCQRCGGTGRV